MTDKAMSPLRRRMIEDMTIRKLAPKTQQGYIRTIKDLAAFLGRSPDTASFEDVRRFQLHLAANGAHVPILNHAVAALHLTHHLAQRPAVSSLGGLRMPAPECVAPSSWAGIRKPSH
jgi:integrase/recombinase XerD